MKFMKKYILNLPYPATSFLNRSTQMDMAWSALDFLSQPKDKLKNDRQFSKGYKDRIQK